MDLIQLPYDNQTPVSHNKGATPPFPPLFTVVSVSRYYDNDDSAEK